MPTRLDHIWNGWRADYVRAVPEQPTSATTSVFRQILESGLPDTETNIVKRGSTCFVILNAFPYTAGHLLVLPYRQVARIDLLDGDESVELWSLTRSAIIAVERAYQPGGVNMGLNQGAAAGGSVAEHLHIHVLPRWVGDSNFVTAVANARTIPEPLSDTATKLRAAWPMDH